MRDLWQKCDKFLIEFSQGIKIIFKQGNKIKMGIFTKFKLTEVLSTFCYLANMIFINKLQNLKTINYDNFNKSMYYQIIAWEFSNLLIALNYKSNKLFKKVG